MYINSSSNNIIKLITEKDYLGLIFQYKLILRQTNFIEYYRLIALIYLYKMKDYKEAYIWFLKYYKFCKNNISANWEIVRLATYFKRLNFLEILMRQIIEFEIEYEQNTKKLKLIIEQKNKTKILPCLFSMQNQTYRNFELFCLIQNSNTLKLYKKLFRFDSRFRFISQISKTDSYNCIVLNNVIYNLNYLQYFIRNKKLPKNLGCLNSIKYLKLNQKFTDNISVIIPFLPEQIGEING